MHTFDKISFKKYTKTLKIDHSSGDTYLNDAYDVVCTVNVTDCISAVENCTVIDGEEVYFTDKQKDELYAMAYEAGQEHIRQYHQYLIDVKDDERHFEHLNRYYR